MIMRVYFFLILSFCFNLLFSQPPDQVRIRIYTDEHPGHIFFRVTSGQYIIDCYDGNPFTVREGDIFIISRFKDKIALKRADRKGFLADSLLARGSVPDASFSLTTGPEAPVYRIYSGILECLPDLGSLLLINSVDIEDYIAGVVKAEGGSGRHVEYFKTQAVIARTYTYHYFDKHRTDRFNLCDDTHCQSFKGLTTDAVIYESVKKTAGEVLVASDSTLIISAFHSNCGGETSPSEYAWLSAHPYLVKVIDPFCVTSKNAAWEKSVGLRDWVEMLSRNGYTGQEESPDQLFFRQPTRVKEYVTGSFRIPFSKIRSELDLRSSWFSVSVKGDSLLLTGKGYGHGVGLCQEGAMVMALSGEKYEDILKFYYPGVSIIGIDKVREDENEINNPIN